jgi:hypothetical protein
MNKMKSFLLILVIAVLFASCSKDGATGAVGPAGPAGTAYVNTYSFTTSNALWTQSGAQWAYSFQDTAMYLTGGIEVFYDDPIGGGYIQLPLVKDSISIFYEEYSATNTIVVYWENVNGVTLPQNPGAKSFEVVVIPQ